MNSSRDSPRPGSCRFGSRGAEAVKSLQGSVGSSREVWSRRVPPVGWAPPTAGGRPGPEMVGGAHPTKSGPLPKGAPRNTRNRERYPTMSRAPSDPPAPPCMAWSAGNNEDDPNPPSGRGRDDPETYGRSARLRRSASDDVKERPMPLQVEGRSPAAASLHVKCPCGRDLGAARAGGRSDHLLVVPRLRPGPRAGGARRLGGQAPPDGRACRSSTQDHHAPLDRRVAGHRRTEPDEPGGPPRREDQGLGADPGRLGRGPVRWGW